MNEPRHAEAVTTAAPPLSAEKTPVVRGSAAAAKEAGAVRTGAEGTVVAVPINAGEAIAAWAIAVPRPIAG